MKRLYRIALCAVLLCLFVTLTAGAATVDLTPTDAFFVNDFAGVLTDEDTLAMYNMGVQLYEKTGAQVVAVTVETTNGVDISQYGVQLGREWGIGDEEDDTGVLLILATEDRDVGISVGYGLEGAITDAKSGILLDNYAVPYFSEDDFSTGMRETYNALINEVYIEFGLEPEEDYVPADELDDDGGSVLIAVLFFIVCLTVLQFVSRGRFPLLFFFGGGNHHHRGGGGFHGGFGGGSSGFRGGGGSFGGGGASRGF